MPLTIIRQDITKIECDAIVNPSNRRLQPGGGTDLAVHKAAGSELLTACKALGGCEVGKAKITQGYNLPCKYVIHTAGPDWHRFINPDKVLISCYKECLKLAKEYGCESVAFPLIASGAYGCPKEKVLKIATDVISEFLFENEMLVYLVVYDKKSFGISKKIFSEVKSYIDDNYVDTHSQTEIRYNTSCSAPFPNHPAQRRDSETEEFDKCASLRLSDESEYGFCEDSLSFDSSEYELSFDTCESEKAELSLEEMLRNMDKGFSETLFYYIDLCGVTDVECYKRSNIDKKTFSKIKCNRNYRPSKKTAVAFAVGLKLNLEQTNHLLNTAGYSLSKSDIFDVIIMYFISTGNYKNIFDVNEMLYRFDQVMLGV